MLVNYRSVHFGYFLLIKVGWFGEPCISVQCPICNPVMSYKDVH